MPRTPPANGIGIIGGSGLYQIDGLSRTRWSPLKSSFGRASDQAFRGSLDLAQAVFLPRHGRGHRIPPSMVNYRANIEGLKEAGCRDLLSISAVGSLKENLPPGTFVIVDQFIDRTFAREKSFFGPGLVAHVSMAHPVCRRLGDHLEAAAKKLKIPHVRGGTYLTMEGPQFSTLAESNLYRSWGCDVIGMTNMPEAKLAREAELCYASVSMVTDFDCWHPGHDHVSVDAIVKTLHDNADKARALVREVLPRLASDLHAGSCSCRTALESAILTAPEARDPKMMKKLKVVAGRVLGRSQA
ncbi:MAG: S-methyl-5'-thioadenosine phosphorylase [Verrucomicrobia bacterium]|nr:S-methyl-5'-thioadenosine phosphorylase [Verrucomicrobiota bacterium]